MVLAFYKFHDLRASLQDVDSRTEIPDIDLCGLLACSERSHLLTGDVEDSNRSACSKTGDVETTVNKTVELESVDTVD